MDRRIVRVFWTLRITFGLVPIVAGLDKFTNLLVDWTSYLGPAAARLLPVAPSTFLELVGIVEIAVGVLVLSRWHRIGAYAAAAWLVAIAVNLLLAGRADIAVRDLVMAVAAWSLGRIGEVVAAEPALRARVREAQT